MDFAVASVVLVVILGILGVPLRLEMLWIPVLVFLLVLLTLACGFFLSAASLFFRDVKYIVEVILTFAIFFTPVFYEVHLFARWAPILLLNPVAPILEGIGSAATGHPLPAPGWFVYSAAVAIGGCALSVAFFKKLEPYFAESV
jgi:ABC-type polysaccharide/polyol phosphate export permease